MKTNDIKALHAKTIEELSILLQEKKEALFKAKMDFSQNKLKNVRLLSTLRDDIARVETVKRNVLVKNEKQIKEKTNNG